MDPTVFAEKDFVRLFNDVHGCGIYFFDRIREWNWYALVYDNSEYEAYYCPELGKLFYANLDQARINLETHQFTVHLATRDTIVIVDMLEDYTQVPSNPHHSKPLPLIEYMTMMGALYTEQDMGLKASTTFHNIHCVGRWIQHNILGLDHTTSFNRPVLQIIHGLMTKQHTVCINSIIFNCLITNSTRTRDTKYSHPVLVTRLCKNLLPNNVFDS